ncbi:MAG: hypothetical protein ACLFSI_06260 [Halorhodospira sp.]
MPACSAAADEPSPAVRVIEANPGDYQEAVRGLRPGTRLELAPGTYRGGLDLRGHQGTEDQPIVIVGPEAGAGTAIFVGQDGRNTVRFQDSAHIELRRLELDGRSANANGIVAEAEGAFSHNITLAHLRIRNYDISQGSTAVTTRSAAWDWSIRNNEIRRVGTGLYLGQPEGGAPFIGGHIEGNHIAETLGYNAQIKHQNERVKVEGMPTERRDTVIRGNTFSKAEGGSSGPRARPNLLVGHWPEHGPGADDRYLIDGNLFYENPHECLFQGEGHVALYNNAFVNRGGDGVVIRPHNDVPKTVQILRNTVVARGFGIRLRGVDPDYQQVVAGNAIFADSPLDLGATEGGDNFTASIAEAADLLRAPEAELGELDLTPVGDALRKERPLAFPEDLPGLDCDGNGQSRTEPFWGAFQP